MHLRRICRHKDGKPHHYWALVESYRTERGPRNRIVSYLGEMDEAERLGMQQALEKSSVYQHSLFDETTPEWIEVNVQEVHTERSRQFGNVWLALELLKKLGLMELFDRLMPSDHAKIPWGTLSAVLVIARFCEPSSELHLAEHFYRSSAMADLIGIPDEDTYDNRLYRTLDQLVNHKDKVQQHLKERFGELFNITYDILLYDVTSTYFEGEASNNDQAKLGYSRDNRSDCKQVCIGLVVNKEGIPLGYELFEGNKHDSKTVETIVKKMETLYGKSDRVWIMDRGMVSPENLTLIGQEGRRYIIGTPKNQLKKFERDLLSKDWQQVQEGLEVKLCPSPDRTDEVFILCRSITRKLKEEAIHNHFIQKIEQGLQKLKNSCDHGRVKTVNIVERRIGRLLQKNQRASSLFHIDVKEQNGTINLSWTVCNGDTDWSRISEGCYLLRTNIKDWSPEELWKAYIQLTDAEEAFRIQKDDLKLRPIWHQKKQRVQAHIFVCFISYVLWKCLAQLCKQAGLGNEPRKVVKEIKNISLTDVVLPTRKGIDIRLRCVSKPDKSLAIIVQKLNLHLPSRLKVNHFL